MTNDTHDYDVIVVGAGFAGMYMVHRVRQLGLSVHAFERASDVGGTWYWNRYPGARCDIDSIDYSYSFDEELQQEWQWTERFSSQAEILRYAEHVAERFDLRRDIQFDTAVTAADWDDAEQRWTIATSDGAVTTARWYIMASGSLSLPKDPEFAGLESFRGDWFQTGNWPIEEPDLAGKRVAVIGTGSSGVQLITEIAPRVDHLTVFQRTPQFSVPAQNRPIPEEYVARVKEDYAHHRFEGRKERGGNMRTLDFPEPGYGVRPTPNPEKAADHDPEWVRAELERRWAFGGAGVMLTSFADLITDPEVNDAVSDFARAKISEIVDDPEMAAELMPHDHPFGTKRLPADSGYFATYNRDNVKLVNLRRTPIEEIVPEGIRCSDGVHECDVIIFATGYDALTGAMLGVDIHGRGGLSLRDVWRDGPRSYLGLTIAGFPNLFMITGPGSPSVLSNVIHSIEQHVQFVGDLLAYAGEHDIETVEATRDAQDEWLKLTTENANRTLLPKANSWYMGANVPGKPRVILPYVGGVWTYRQILEQVQADGYEGLELGAQVRNAEPARPR